MASYVKEVASRSGRVASPYLGMVINPFDSKSTRYPDETIVPTALVRLTASETFTVDSPAASSGFWSFLNWKVLDLAGTDPVTSATYTKPVAFGGTVVYTDYGAPQSAWRPLDAVDRTLACAVRVRLMGLPTSTFVPSGTLYFLQYQPGEFLSLDTEVECIQAVTARKGFSLTLAELARLGAVHIPFLPQGPMSYVFSTANTEASGGLPGTSAVGPVAPNGGLMVVGFGIQENAVLRYDYAHHVEYIPKVASAGLVETKVELPSVVERESIAKGSQSVLNAIAGGTSASDIKVLRGSSARAPWSETLSSGLSTLDSMVSTMSRLSSSASGSGLMKLLGGF
jgi:hypothetical protein